MYAAAYFTEAKKLIEQKVKAAETGVEQGMCELFMLLVHCHEIISIYNMLLFLFQGHAEIAEAMLNLLLLHLMNVSHPIH